MHIVCSKILTDTWNVGISKSCCCLTKALTNKKTLLRLLRAPQQMHLLWTQQSRCTSPLLPYSR